MKEIDITKHKFVPKHKKLSDKEATELLKKHNIERNQLPVILKKDAAIQNLEANTGDIIEIERDSPTIGKSYFYRVVK